MPDFQIKTTTRGLQELAYALWGRAFFLSVAGDEYYPEHTQNYSDRLFNMVKDEYNARYRILLDKFGDPGDAVTSRLNDIWNEINWREDTPSSSPYKEQFMQEAQGYREKFVKDIQAGYWADAFRKFMAEEAVIVCPMTPDEAKALIWTLGDPEVDRQHHTNIGKETKEALEKFVAKHGGARSKSKK